MLFRSVHIRQLRAVLGELRKAGLTANPAKCRLGLEETAYLGYQVGRGTVRPQESKVAAIRDWPQPRPIETGYLLGRVPGLPEA